MDTVSKPERATSGPEGRKWMNLRLCPMGMSLLQGIYGERLCVCDHVVAKIFGVDITECLLFISLPSLLTAFRFPFFPHNPFDQGKFSIPNLG